MDIKKLINNFDSESNLNATLDLLYDILVETDPELKNKISDLILNPERIENSNKFSEILVSFSHSEFIEPLRKMIIDSKYPEDKWLSDYLFALSEILDNNQILLDADNKFVEKIGNLIFETGDGGVSMMASGLLGNLKNELTIGYLKRAISDRSLFHVMRSSCVSGLVNQFGESEREYLQDFIDDPEEEFSLHIIGAIDYLNKTRI